MTNREARGIRTGPGRGTSRRLARAWPYALPAFIALVVSLGYPLIDNIWISFHVDRLSADDGTFVGLENYAEILKQGELLWTIVRTLVFTFGSIVFQFIIGLGAALTLEIFPRAARVFRPLLLMPWIIPGVAVAAIWLAILNPLYGLANRLLGFVGVEPIQWLTSSTFAMASLILVNTWKAFPYWMLMLSAGLKSISKEVIEAAQVDGASYLRVLWSVILPGLRPVLAATGLLAFIWTFNYFDLAYLLTNGGPDHATTTLPFAIWESSLKFNRFDQAAAYSVLTILMTGIAIVFYLRANRKAGAT